MKIDVPLEIDDEIWIISNREPKLRIIAGLHQRKSHGEIVTKYETENWGNKNINSEYFLSEKDAEIEIARKILEGLKDGN